MSYQSISYCSFPRTVAPPDFVVEVVSVFNKHLINISTRILKKGLTSNEVKDILRKDLISIGFKVEGGKRSIEKIDRPVFYGEDGLPTLRYEIDAYHPDWKCGLEIEAGRAVKGNAIYRDLIQALVMVEVEYLILAVPKTYKYKLNSKEILSKDYDKTKDVADSIYGHTRIQLPYKLIVLGY